MTAAEILAAHQYINLKTPTREQLGCLTPDEVTIVLDGIIDRTLPDHISGALAIVIPFAALTHRWIERQLQSVEKLPPLLPWWIGGRT